MLFSLLSLLESRTATKPSPGCLQCGQCCESFGGHLRASAHDLQRWQEDGRQDLLDCTNHLGWIWVDPSTKARVAPCPHIDRSDPEQVRCAIYAHRPAMCRDYPTLAHGRRCLRGVFLSWWTTITCSPVLDWMWTLEELPLAA